MVVDAGSATAEDSKSNVERKEDRATMMLKSGLVDWVGVMYDDGRLLSSVISNEVVIVFVCIDSSLFLGRP